MTENADRLYAMPADIVREVTGGNKKKMVGPERGAGAKFDTGKDPWGLLPWKPIRGVVKILAYGARGKYKELPPDNWRRVENGRERYYEAAMRHLVEWRMGNKIDDESGLPHLWHALCDLVFVCELDE